MNTALDVATALASLLADLGLDGCVACPWTALIDDTERVVLRVFSTDNRTVVQHFKEYA